MVRRAAALLALFAANFAYDDLAPHLWRAGVWWDVAWIAFVLMPATFGMVLLALPWRTGRLVPRLAVGFIVLAVVLTVVHAQVSANFARLAAATLLAWWFLELFEALSWVVLVACVIPWVDAYSVWRGPTKTITTKHPHIFSDLAYAFPVPGQHRAASLGMPDLLFFALFLGTAARFGLRVYWTWACSVALLGATIAATVWWGISGLPALPAVSIGFVVPNADLIWARLRRKPRLADGADVPLGGPADDG